MTRKLILLFLLALMWGCESKPHRASVPAAPEPSSESTASEQPSTTGTSTSPTSDETSQEKATASRYADGIYRYFGWRAGLERELVEERRKSMTMVVARLLRFRKLTLAAYTAREFNLFLSIGDKLTEDGVLAVELIKTVESHGLEASPYPLERLHDGLAAYETQSKTLEDHITSPNTGSEDTDKLVRLIVSFERRPDELYADTKSRLEKSLLAAGLTDNAPVKTHLLALQKWTRRIHEVRRTLRKALEDVDLAVVQGFFQYALDFKHMIIAHPYKALKREDHVKGPWLYREALAEDIKAASNGLGKTMRSWWPKHPYYEKTRHALEYYSKLAKEKTVPRWTIRKRLKLGKKGPEVVQLKERLAAEGFYDGDLEEPVFDEPLKEAVKRYQEHHHLKADGVVRNGRKIDLKTHGSLNVPMSSRVRQLQLGLQRWRETSTAQHEGQYYFRVNIPQFEVEVWDSGELLRTHKVIVGNNRHEEDEWNGRAGHLNRTALLTKTITKVVLNPVWNVPTRIVVYELEKEAEKNPDFYEKHGYIRRELSDGTVIIRQSPGPRNALGQVKLLFPNRHSIYMHDTPKKRLFRRTMRAFSHGCMRLHNPIDMAKFVLERDRGVTADDVDKVLKSELERGYSLKKPIPIHIEYNTIAFRAGEEMPIFLNDVYSYDKEFWRGTLPTIREKKIPIVRPDPEEETEQDEDISEEEKEHLETGANADAAPPSEADNDAKPKETAVEKVKPKEAVLPAPATKVAPNVETKSPNTDKSSTKVEPEKPPKVEPEKPPKVESEKSPKVESEKPPKVEPEKPPKVEPKPKASPRDALPNDEAAPQE